MSRHLAVIRVILLALFAPYPVHAQTTAATIPANRGISAAAVHGMVATGHPIATDAAVDVLRQGLLVMVPVDQIEPLP